MRLEGERESANVEDRRGGGLPIGVAGGGIGTVVLVVLALLMGVDPRAILSGDVGSVAPPQSAPGSRYAPEDGASDEARRFVSRVLASTEDVWTAVFREHGRRYDPPRLVLFSGAVRSGCGVAGSAVGPFYCPADRHVYIDLAFFRDMQRQLGAPGDFAQAYVIAHEVGHHVQHLLGTMDKVNAAQQRLRQGEANQMSVRLELQADCYAGVWANHADRRGIVEPGDVEEALTAASAIGDDRLQRESQGYVVPDSFTHGSSAQRVRWFRVGLESGDARRCDTFSTRSL
jgi:predicted metalloprotease